MLFRALAGMILLTSSISLAQSPVDAELRVQQALQRYRSATRMDEKISAAKELCFNPGQDAQDGLLEILHNETAFTILEGSARCLSWMGDLNAVRPLLSLMSELPQRTMKRLPSLREIILSKQNPHTSAFSLSVFDQLGFAVYSIVKRYPVVVPQEIEVAVRQQQTLTPSSFLASTLKYMEERKQVKPETADGIEYAFPSSQL